MPMQDSCQLEPCTVAAAVERCNGCCKNALDPLLVATSDRHPFKRSVTGQLCDERTPTFQRRQSSGSGTPWRMKTRTRILAAAIWECGARAPALLAP